MAQSEVSSEEETEDTDKPSGIYLSPLVLVLAIALIVVALVLMFFIGRQSAPNCNAVVDSTPNAAQPQQNNQPQNPEVIPSQQGDTLNVIKALQKMDDPARTLGPESAPLHVIEYSDYSCPMCTKAHQDLDPVFMRYAEDGKIRFEVRDLTIFAGQYHSDLAAIAARAAAEQGKFWEFRAALYDAAGTDHPTYTQDSLIQVAQKVGIADMDKFKAALSDQSLAQKVAEETSTAMQVGLNGTPAILIGNAFVSGAYPPDVVEATILDQLSQAQGSK